jgi:low temperature requirement protein LtrA
MSNLDVFFEDSKVFLDGRDRSMDGGNLVQLTETFAVPSADLLNEENLPANLEAVEELTTIAKGDPNLTIFTTEPPEEEFRWLKHPHLRQEWLDSDHKILRRDKYVRRAGLMELYYDLIFVAVIAQVGHAIRFQSTLSVSFVLEFIALFHIWMETVFFLDRFDNDDGLNRILILLVMAGVVGMGITVESARSQDGFGYIIAFIWARSFIEVMHFVTVAIPAVQKFVFARQFFFVGVLSFWIGSLWAPNEGVRYGLQFIGLCVGYCAPIIISALPGRFGVSIPLNLEHIVERFSLFSIIIIGETIVAIFFVEGGAYIVNEWATAGLGLLLSFCLQWIFFDLENGHHATKLEQHAFSRGWQSYIWIFSHIPADLGIICLAAGVWNVNRAYVRVDVVSNITLCLQNATFARSDDPFVDLCNVDPFSYGRWILCVGAGASLFFITINGAMHKRSEARKGDGYIQKFSLKIAVRLIAVITLCLVSLSGSLISPLGYLGICCAMYCALVVIGLVHRRTLKKVGDKIVAVVSNDTVQSEAEFSPTTRDMMKSLSSRGFDLSRVVGASFSQ